MIGGDTLLQTPSTEWVPKHLMWPWPHHQGEKNRYTGEKQSDGRVNEASCDRCWGESVALSGRKQKPATLFPVVGQQLYPELFCVCQPSKDKSREAGEAKSVGAIVSMVIILSSLVRQHARGAKRRNKNKKIEMNETPGSHCSRKQFPRLNLVMQSPWASSAFGN